MFFVPIVIGHSSVTVTISVGQSGGGVFKIKMREKSINVLFVLFILRTSNKRNS